MLAGSHAMASQRPRCPPPGREPLARLAGRRGPVADRVRGAHRNVWRTVAKRRPRRIRPRSGRRPPGMAAARTPGARDVDLIGERWGVSPTWVDAIAGCSTWG